MSNMQNLSRFDRSSRLSLILFIHDDVDQIIFSKDLNRFMQKNRSSLTNMIQKMQNHVIAQKVELNEIVLRYYKEREEEKKYHHHRKRRCCHQTR